MSATPIYKIIIADDQTIVAEGISALLEQQPDFKVIGLCSNGKQLINLLGTEKPDLVLLDLNMPVLDGFKACQVIREKFPEMLIVAFTMYDDDKIVQRIKAAGADGVLWKYYSSAEITSKLRQLLTGKVKKSFSATKTRSNNQQRATDKFLLLHKISERELEIIRLIAQGLNSEEIGEKLFISEHTVNTHRKNILERLKVRNTAELINFMHQNGLL